MSLRTAPWPGVRQDVTDLGDGLIDALNVQYRKQGELQRRPGLGQRYGLSATQLGFLSSVGGNHMIAFDGTTLTSLNMDTAATTSLATGVNTARGSFALANGILYYANGTDSVRAISNGAAVSRPAGITTPTAATDTTRVSGNMNVGTRLVRTRWKAASTGYLSNPSSVLALNTGNRSTATGTVSVTNGSASVTFSASQPAWTSSANLFIGGVDFGLINVSGTSGTLVTAFGGTTGSYAFSLEEASIYSGWNITIAFTPAVSTYVTNRVIEMTEVDGSTFYVVATIASNLGSYELNVSDSVLNQGELADVTSAPDGFGHEPPPAALRTLMSSRNRLFGLDATGTLYWSRAAYPEGWKALEWSQKVFSNGGDKAVALGNFMSDIYVFGQRSMARLVYNGDPASGMFAQMPTSFGVWNQNCVVEVEGALWGWGRQGIFRITEIQPKYMSGPVAETLKADPDFTASENFFAFYDPQERVLWFCYKAAGDTGVRRAVCFDLQTREWHRRSTRHKMNHAIVSGDASRDDFAYVADDDGGYTWRITDDMFDGVPSAMASGVVTADVGSTDTIINTLEPVADVIGCILYDPATGDERRITGYTASSVTLASALSVAPAVGSAYWIGSIHVTLRSQWIPLSYVYEGRRPEYLEMLHLSTTSGVVFNVSYYQDYSTAATSWNRVADDAMMNGLNITDGATYATQDVSSGKNSVPVPADFSTTIQYKLDQVKPLGLMRLLNASFTYNDQRGAKEIGS